MRDGRYRKAPAAILLLSVGTALVSCGTPQEPLITGHLVLESGKTADLDNPPNWNIGEPHDFAENRGNNDIRYVGTSRVLTRHLQSLFSNVVNPRAIEDCRKSTFHGNGPVEAREAVTACVATSEGKSAFIRVGHANDVQVDVDVTVYAPPIQATPKGAGGIERVSPG